MIAAATSKYVSPSPRTRATTDQPQAASVPSETSVSMVAAPCRRLRSAARWNESPPQRTTGVARANDSHSQPGKRSGGIMPSATTGAVSAAETASLRPSGRAADASSSESTAR